MLAALAEFERELILERTRAGIVRAPRSGQRFGAPRRISESVAREVWERGAQGESLRMISQCMNIKLGGVRSVLQQDTGHGRHVAESPASTLIPNNRPGGG